MDFHFQILLYNGSKFLEKLFKSFSLVELSTDDIIHIHFLDQSDNEDELKRGKKYIDKQKKKMTSQINITYDQGKNIGFGKGHNKIFTKYQDQYQEDFIILNQDVFLYYDFLSKLKWYKEKLKNKNWGMLEPIQFPSEHPKYFDPKTLETRWCSGACTLINKVAFLESNMFDPNIFMYCEDVDLSIKMKYKGYKLFVMPKVKFLHITQAFDTNKDQSFEFIHSQATNIYLREKYATKEDVEAFIKLIKAHPDYDKKIIDLYEEMANKLKDSDKLKVKFLLPDGDYTMKRW